MIIRSLEPGEEPLWIACGTPPEQREKRLARLLAHRESFPEDPLCFLIALENGRFIAKLRACMPRPNLYLIERLIVEPDFPFDSIAALLIDYVVKNNSGRAIEAINGDDAEDSGLDTSLKRSGFHEFIRKKLFERFLGDYVNPYQDPFDYSSFSEAGRAAFIEAIRRINENTLNRDINPLGADAELSDLVEHAGAAFDETMWKLAFHEGRLAGLVFPQIYPDARDQGSIFNIGLVPECRSRGWGKILHARGIEEIQMAGASRYIGSTDANNTPMLRIFGINGCSEIGIQRIYRHSPGRTSELP
jgi:ribosomal protein S18 acetylase RimI-like enzyme